MKNSIKVVVVAVIALVLVIASLLLMQDSSLDAARIALDSNDIGGGWNIGQGQPSVLIGETISSSYKEFTNETMHFSLEIDIFKNNSMAFNVLQAIQYINENGNDTVNRTTLELGDGGFYYEFNPWYQNCSFYPAVVFVKGSVLCMMSTLDVGSNPPPTWAGEALLHIAEIQAEKIDRT